MIFDSVAASLQTIIDFFIGTTLSNSNLVLAATITDDDLALGSDITISWPKSDSRFNHCTVKFNNEFENFKEDSASWPPKISGTFDKGVGGVIYSSVDGWDQVKAGGALLNSVGVWNTSEDSVTLEWKIRARETGTHTIKFTVDDSGSLEVIDSSNITIHTLNVNDWKAVFTGTVFLTKDQIYTIRTTATSSSGLKGIAGLMKAPSGVEVWSTRDIAYTDIIVKTYSNAIYQTMLQEDGGVLLETESFEEGITDYYHALARAEEVVRTSRTAFSIEFDYLIKDRFLEPGDYIKISSEVLNLPDSSDYYFRVEESEVQDNLTCKIKATRFHWAQLAWNVKDDVYVNPQSWTSFAVSAPTSVRYTATSSKFENSSGIVSWIAPNDDKVVGYIVYMAAQGSYTIEGELSLKELGRTVDTSFILPLLSAGDYVFGVQSITALGRKSIIVLTQIHSTITGATPPAPTNALITISDDKKFVNVAWEVPSLRADGSNYSDHQATLVFKTTTNAFDNPEQLAEVASTSRYSDASEPGTWYYWVRNLSKKGIVSDTTFAGYHTFAEQDTVFVDTTPPPTPYNFTAIAEYNTITLNWTVPSYTEGQGHKETIVYVAEKTGASAPTFDNAIIVARVQDNYYVFTGEANKIYYFWLKEVSRGGGISIAAAGPVFAQTAINIEQTIALLTDRLKESQLTQDLRNRIDKIDDPTVGLVNKVTDLVNVYGDTASAATSAIEAADAAGRAVNSLVDSLAAKAGAKIARDEAVTANIEASTSAGEAQVFASDAAFSATTAEESASSADSAKQLAASSAFDSAGSASAAKSSADAAVVSSQNAATYANDSYVYSVASAESNIAANTAKDGAQAAAQASSTSKEAAIAAQTAAETYAIAASSSALNASTYAGSAQVFSEASASSAIDAQGHATSAASILTQVKAVSTGFFNTASWAFDTTEEGWVGVNATLTTGTSSIILASSGEDPILRSPSISISGKFSPLVRVRLKRTGGTGWQGDLFYTTTGHSESGSYKKNLATNPTLADGWVTLEWDMSGIADWNSNQIAQLRFDFGNTAADSFEIDWVAVGSISPPESISPSVNIANCSWWAPGVAFKAGWEPYDTASENVFVTGQDYSNRSNTLLRVIAANDTGTADGGFSKGSLIAGIDRTKTYRFVIPVKRTTNAGTFRWHVSGVNVINSNTLKTDAYFFANTLPEVDKWYLAIGYVFPNGSISNTNDSAGLYNVSTGKKVASGSNFCWNATADVYYSAQQFTADAGATMLFGKPMIHIMDGSELPESALFIISQNIAASIDTLATTVAGPDGATAQYTVKVDSNGYVAGYGLSSASNTAGASTSEFTIIADQFSIAPVSSDATEWSAATTYSINAKVKYLGREYISLQASNFNKNPSTQTAWWSKKSSPFFHLTAPQVIDGITVPAGTYMDNAYIINLSADKIKSGTATIGSGAFGLGGTETLNGYPATGRFQTTSANGFALLGFQDSTTDDNCAIAGVHRSNSGFGLGAYNASTPSYSAFYTTAVFALGGAGGYGGLMKYNRSVTTNNNLSLTPYSQGIIGSKDNAGFFTWYGETSTYQRTAAYICNATTMAGAVFRYYPNSTVTESKELRICDSAYAAVAVAGKGKIYAADGFTPFTGAHDGIISDSTITQGDILVDFKVLKQLDISNSIVEYKLSSVPNQKGAIGVLNQVHDTLPTDWAEVFANPKGSKDPMVDPSNYQEPPEFVPNPDYYPIPALYKVVTVNALGEGQINVCGENGNIEIGDLIVTSSTPGKGMKQSDDIVRSYSVAKARQSVTFNDPSEIKQIACIYIGG